MSRKKFHYHIDQKPQPKRRKGRIIFISLFAILLLSGGLYVSILTQSPEFITDTPEAAKMTEERLASKNQDFLKIERLNLVEPYTASEGDKAIEGGFRWRYPERGNPEDGGNFILCAQHFKFGLTPSQTKERSPFYHIEQVEINDLIDVNFKGQRYSYRVIEEISDLQDRTQIEAPSDNAKLTLHACSSNGSADKGAALVATPVAHPDTVSSGDEGEDVANPLL